MGVIKWTQKKRIISVVLCATIIIPLLFYKPTKIYAQNEFGLNGEQFVDWFLTSVGGAMVENGSMVGLDPDVFYGMLYNTPLTVENYPMSASGTYTFTPSQEFGSKNEWIKVCNGSWDPQGPASTFWQSFDLADCFIDSGFIEQNENGVKIKEIPTLSDSTDLSEPLDGVEVLTNFGSFYPDFSNLNYPYLAKQMIDATEQSFDGNNYIIVAGYCAGNSTTTVFNYYRYDFYAYNDDTNYVFLRKDANGNSAIYRAVARYNNTFKDSSKKSTWLMMSTKNVPSYKNGYQNYTPTLPFVAGSITFNDSNINAGQPNESYFTRIYDAQIYSNQPVVVASSTIAGENYYYWKNQIPSGIMYTSNNINQTYNYNTLNNTNWSSTYNNYISDISNTYSTTENITNQQITQYIDDSTTITNITNNYIVNGSGSGEGGSGEGGSGGSGQDDLLTNSWLERIYNKNVQILKAIMGDTYDPDQDITYYTDNSIKNEIIRYPASDLFPDVPIDKFLDTTADFTVDAFASALSSVLTQAVPFCYIVALFEVANVMSAQPKAPKWDIPFKIQRLGIDEIVTIDMTDNAWEVVHNIWIVLIMILLVALLFYLSYKILHLAAVIFG